MRDICPNLNDGNHAITSPQCPLYNCVAWSVELQLFYVWPDADEQYQWPIDLPRNEEPASFARFFELLGYRLCRNADRIADLEKIAIYSKDGATTHVARQLTDGKWTSKIGDLADIAHKSIDDVEGGKYGTVALLMARDSTVPRPPLPKMHPGPVLVTPTGVSVRRFLQNKLDST